MHFQFSNRKESYNSGVAITIMSLTLTEIRVGGSCVHNVNVTTPANPTKIWKIMKTATKLKIWRDSQLVLEYGFEAGEKCVKNWSKETTWFWFKTVRAPKSGDRIFYRINKIASKYKAHHTSATIQYEN